MDISQALSQALYYLSRLINILILIRVVLSWVNPNPRNVGVQFIYSVTEPILAPVRNLIYKLGYNGIIDFSPLAAIFLVNIVYYFIANLL